MADELDTEPTSSTPDPSESPRAPYLAVLRRHRDTGTLSETDYDARVADVADAATYGDLETAVRDLDRGDLPVPTKRRQRRELPDAAAPVAADEVEDEPADAVVDDEDDTDADLAVEDDDDTDDDTDDDDPVDDEPVAENDAVSTDDSDSDSDSDEDDDDRELVTAGAGPRTTSGTGSSARRRSGSPATTGGTKGKGRPTRTRKEATRVEERRTGPVTFIKESVAELRKVVYPTGQQLRNYFVVVLVFVLFIIGVTSGLDLAFGQLVLQVFGR